MNLRQLNQLQEEDNHILRLKAEIAETDGYEFFHGSPYHYVFFRVFDLDVPHP